MMFRQILLLSAVMPVMALAGGDTYFTGDGTSYTLGQVSAGNCNFMYDPGVGDNYAALNNEQWDSTHNCGRCAEVSCDDARCSDTTSTQIVYIVDRCPECKQGDLDLSPAVFKTLTGSDPSRYTIKWKFVDCPVSGNIEYCTKSGSSSSWLAIQPANYASGVASMKIANQDVTMVDSCYYFLLNGGSNVDMSAVSVELTSVSGEIITETLSLTADKCTEGTSNFGASTTQQSSTSQTNQNSTSQTSQTAPTPTTAAPTPTPTTAAPTPTPTTSPPTTPAPAATTATPTATTATPTSYTFTSSTSSQSQTQQREVSNYFNSLTNSSSSTSYKAGKVTAADESGSDVSILQSSEAGVEKTSNTQQQDDENGDTTQTAGSNTKQVNTKSAAESSGTSPVVVALIVLAVVGGIALAAIAYVVKKKKLDDKQIDRNEAMIRSFDTFSSPVEINATNIAKI